MALKLIKAEDMDSSETSSDFLGGTREAIGSSYKEILSKLKKKKNRAIKSSSSFKAKNPT